ncbi:histidinol dehydrogenase [Chitinophaga ginsengisegetis]|uniref:histidinol dehydrogenase n=1 Tax=Chitinophaga ginsengisegetis TaxID=393003 RepID=UPI000DB96271|nr:histidinol dehydrogenase [Chitinophaga ginsengisegetis]MDR6566962.1 histidinol dehydrogenase [Chitinophaga ginsengisegetis]MDR6646692.1 histidinol dehydrogenase [Chitinophaga ginsengisegetis]MDR6653042.1 histidinol dehydrogenase [Chitinophaga ginsengisegetis]
MQITRFPDKNSWNTLLQRPVMDTSTLEKKVNDILQEVRTGGDAAVRKFAAEFDKVTLDNLQVPSAAFAAAEATLEPALKGAIQQAAKNITTFHRAQQEKVQVIETMPGVQCWRKSVAIQKVGLYIPGGSAPLFSTILMLGIPAMIAGCKEIVLCTPSLHPAILYTAQLTGIEKVFTIGGVQAIGAMAYGTESVPQVYKIFGPGNQYVTCAKQLVNKSGVAIDMPAGPSEVAVLADDSCVPAFVAADLLSQAEHGPDSQVVLVTTSEKVLTNVTNALNAQLDALPRKGIATAALENSKMILVKDMDTAIEMLNTYAPEHLILACEGAENLADKVTDAGSVFMGNYTPESAGDYASGTNHTLPTNGYARAYSGVSLDSFVKKITFQQISPEGLQNIGSTIEAMAAAEGLEAHKNAVTVRLKQLEYTGSLITD